MKNLNERILFNCFIIMTQFIFLATDWYRYHSITMLALTYILLTSLLAFTRYIVENSYILNDCYMSISHIKKLPLLKNSLPYNKLSLTPIFNKIIKTKGRLMKNPYESRLFNTIVACTSGFFLVTQWYEHHTISVMGLVYLILPSILIFTKARKKNKSEIMDNNSSIISPSLEKNIDLEEFNENELSLTNTFMKK